MVLLMRRTGMAVAMSRSAPEAPGIVHAVTGVFRFRWLGARDASGRAYGSERMNAHEATRCASGDKLWRSCRAHQAIVWWHVENASGSSINSHHLGVVFRRRARFLEHSWKRAASAELFNDFMHDHIIRHDVARIESGSARLSYLSPLTHRRAVCGSRRSPCDGTTAVPRFTPVYPGLIFLCVFNNVPG